MKSKSWFKNIEKGQVLPIVVISLFALIAMAALMIDGGMLLSHRRTAQAAADAGALAGAESLCPGGGGESNARIVAQDYIARNNAVEESITFPKPDTSIRVETSVTTNGTFFAWVFGETDLTATAAAEATCAPLRVATGVLPIAFPCYPEDHEGEKYTDLVSDSEVCYVKYGDPDYGNTLSENVQWNIDNNNMVIVMDTDPDKDKYCSPKGPIKCDYEGDEAKRLLAGKSNKGWLSLDGIQDPSEDNPGQGANKTCAWMKSGFDGQISVNTWLSGTGGKRAKIFNNCNPDPIPGDYVVPIFDKWCEGIDPEYQDKCTPYLWDKDVDSKNVTEGSSLNYRIVGFAIFRITCMQGPGGGNPCPYRDHLEKENILDKAPQTFSIEGYFIEGQVSWGGADGPDIGAFVVQLTE